MSTIASIDSNIKIRMNPGSAIASVRVRWGKLVAHESTLDTWTASPTFLSWIRLCWRVRSYRDRQARRFCHLHPGSASPPQSPPRDDSSPFVVAHVVKAMATLYELHHVIHARIEVDDDSHDDIVVRAAHTWFQLIPCMGIATPDQYLVLVAACYLAQWAVCYESEFGNVPKTHADAARIARCSETDIRTAVWLVYQLTDYQIYLTLPTCRPRWPEDAAKTLAKHTMLVEMHPDFSATKRMESVLLDMTHVVVDSVVTSDWDSPGSDDPRGALVRYFPKEVRPPSSISRSKKRSRWIWVHPSTPPDSTPIRKRARIQPVCSR